jgi:iron complex outermembrane receptor protein
LVGNPNLKSETVLAYELGYRVQPAKWISLDITGFYNHYDNLISVGQISGFLPGIPFGIAEIPWQNNQSGHTIGGEVSLTVSPTAHWHLIGTYSSLREVIEGSPSTPITDPANQATLRSAYDFTKKLSGDVQIRFVDSFSSVPYYWTADVRLSYRPIDSLEIALVGQNLFQNQHLEQPVYPFVTTAEIPWGFYGKVTWRF